MKLEEVSVTVPVYDIIAPPRLLLEPVPVQLVNVEEVTASVPEDKESIAPPLPDADPSFSVRLSMVR